VFVGVRRDGMIADRRCGDEKANVPLLQDIRRDVTNSRFHPTKLRSEESETVAIKRRCLFSVTDVKLDVVDSMDRKWIPELLRVHAVL